MSYEEESESTDLKVALKRIEDLNEIVFELGVNVGEENATAPPYDSQGKIRYVSPP